MYESWSGLVAPDASGDSLATPFEDWCQSQGIHPEAFGAWESFEATRTSGSTTRAASGC